MHVLNRILFRIFYAKNFEYKFKLQFFDVVYKINTQQAPHSSSSSIKWIGKKFFMHKLFSCCFVGENFNQCLDSFNANFLPSQQNPKSMLMSANICSAVPAKKSTNDHTHVKATTWWKFSNSFFFLCLMFFYKINHSIWNVFKTNTIFNCRLSIL